MSDPFYITTPIYYANDAPHIGHAYCTINCDAIARWHRLIGDDTFLLTGTDEHGLKVQRAAEAAGLTPQELVGQTSDRYRQAWKLLDISNDDFIRTSEPRHYEAVQALLGKIRDNGHIELGTYEGLYCVSCEDYYTDAQAPDGLCPIHNRPLEVLAEENYFFRLSRFEQPLLDWYDAHPDFVQPSTKRNEALGFIKQGLQDISITRTSIDWGVPVPWDPKHVFYVWYDALINYATAVGYGTDPERFAKWWPHVHHVIGKEIMRFHCVWWPAMLLAAGELPPSRVQIHGWLLVGGEKMSKTRLNQIAPGDLVDDFGVDATRYHFLRDVAFGNDGDFSYEGMVARYNSDLANNLGNLLSRVATVVDKKCGGVGPAPDPASPLAGVAAEVVDATSDAWARLQPHEALEATWRLIREANAHLETNEPWKAEPGPDVDRVLGDALEVLRIVAVLASPALPTTVGEIWSRIGLDGVPQDQRVPDAVAWGGYPGGLPVEKGAPLFPRRKD
ncbi:MAG: methionyl-tRNA synthetase [Actinomycetota bacterium]|nr:methionyl-tRNA synthetase [Actinomycetota bacterium]